MIAVIFEVSLAAGGQDAYLAHAEALRSQLATMDGFLCIERFQSLAQPDKLLSLSFWRDEAALAGWRQLEAHRQAQAAGRDGLFADYRLRVAEVCRDYGMQARAQAPADSRRCHDGEEG